MALRNLTLNSSRAHTGGHAINRLRAGAAERPYFPDALVPILDDYFSDADVFEPDGVNDFVRQFGPEPLDRH